MSILGALSRIPKILEANVNAAIHYDNKKPAPIKTPDKQNPVVLTNADKTPVKHVDPAVDVVTPKKETQSPEIKSAVMDLEKELMESNMAPKGKTGSL